MTALEFLRSDGAVALFERASRAGGIPVSLHYVERNQEGPRMASWGHCAACRWISQQEGGITACRASRTTASAVAIRQGRCIPFVCHLGFSCAVIPVLEDEQFALTLGPYCPAEESRSLESDVLAGIEALLNESADVVPVALDDIHHAPAEAIPVLAEWVAEDARVAYQGAKNSETDATAEETTQETASTSRRSVRASAPWAAGVATALAGGNQPQARALLLGLLEERGGKARASAALRAAVLLHAVGAVFEALEKAGFSTEAAWKKIPALLACAGREADPKALLDAAMEILGAARRVAAPKRSREKTKTGYVALNELLTKRLVEGLSLNEGARLLGDTPSALSHRLQRNFGLSYSEYVARLRIDRAKELLRRTLFSVSEIGRRVGIADQSNFSKVFKKMEGLTPSEYRKRHGKKK
jgi:AraC-like DNA-binding protein